eukprot:6185400-Pleurochrysis_carterae.AAC.1
MEHQGQLSSGTRRVAQRRGATRPDHRDGQQAYGGNVGRDGETNMQRRQLGRWICMWGPRPRCDAEHAAQKKRCARRARRGHHRTCRSRHRTSVRRYRRQRREQERAGHMPCDCESTDDAAAAEEKHLRQHLRMRDFHDKREQKGRNQHAGQRGTHPYGSRLQSAVDYRPRSREGYHNTKHKESCNGRWKRYIK